MTAYLIGDRLGQICDVWHGTEQELRDRFDIEGEGYRLEIYDGDPSLDGSLVCDLRLR